MASATDLPPRTTDPGFPTARPGLPATLALMTLRVCSSSLLACLLCGALYGILMGIAIPLLAYFRLIPNAPYSLVQVVLAIPNYVLPYSMLGMVLGLVYGIVNGVGAGLFSHLWYRPSRPPAQYRSAMGWVSLVLSLLVSAALIFYPLYLYQRDKWNALLLVLVLPVLILCSIMSYVSGKAAAGSACLGLSILAGAVLIFNPRLPEYLRYDLAPLLIIFVLPVLILCGIMWYVSGKAAVWYSGLHGQRQSQE